MIVVKLREAMRAYERRTGENITYAELATRTGLARATIEAIGSRPSYNTTLETIDRLCTALSCDLSELIQLVTDDV